MLGKEGYGAPYKTPERNGEKEHIDRRSPEKPQEPEKNEDDQEENQPKSNRKKQKE